MLIGKALFPLLLCRIILYAIAMLDYDQDNTETCRHLLKTKEGIDRLALYITSMGRSFIIFSFLALTHLWSSFLLVYIIIGYIEYNLAFDSLP